MTNRNMPKFLTGPWAISAWLWLLGSLPIFLMGIFSVSSALGWIEPIPDTENYIANPVPITLHVVGGSLMMLIGPLQVNSKLRLRRRFLHKLLGRVFWLAGMVTGASAIWMAVHFPFISGLTTFLSNIVFGILLLGSLIAAMVYVRKGDIARHRAWVLRSYALALGPATQRLLFMPYFLVFGLSEDPILGLLLILGWVINFAVLEIGILKSFQRAARLAPAE